MMKEYEKPTMVLIRFTANDVICASETTVPTNKPGETPIIVF